MYLFLTPSKTDGRVPNQQPDLLGRFPADVPVCPDITGQLGVVRGQNSSVGGGGGKIAKWVWAKGDIYPFNEGGGGRGKRFRTNNT